MKIANNWNFDSLNNDGTGAKVFACQRQIHQCTDGNDSITAHILLVKESRRRISNVLMNSQIYIIISTLMFLSPSHLAIFLSEYILAPISDKSYKDILKGLMGILDSIQICRRYQLVSVIKVDTL